MKYTLKEGCTRCNYKNESLNYLKPYFTISEIELNKNLLLEHHIFKLLNNELAQCGICGLTKEGKIIDEEHPNYFRIISNIEIPNFIFFLLRFIE